MYVCPRTITISRFNEKEGDGELQPAATTVEREALVTGLKGGSPVEIQVSAINIAGESLPSVPAQIVVPRESQPRGRMHRDNPGKT